MSEQPPGRETSISRDPIGIDPIGNEPLDFSNAAPKQGDGSNRTIGGWFTNVTGVFIAAIVLGVIFIAIIVMFASRT